MPVLYRNGEPVEGKWILNYHTRLVFFTGQHSTLQVEYLCHDIRNWIQDTDRRILIYVRRECVPDCQQLIYLDFPRPEDALMCMLKFSGEVEQILEGPSPEFTIHRSIYRGKIGYYQYAWPELV